jgi:ABC-type glycerol-3-phosphate transport system substrate-binding protein
MDRTNAFLLLSGTQANLPMGNHQKQGILDNITADGRSTSIDFTRLVLSSLLLCGILLVAACSAPPSPTTRAPSRTPEFSPTSTSIPATRTPTPTITPLPTSSLGVKEADLDGLTLKFWHPWSGDTGNAIQESLAEFNASNQYGITVEGISHSSLNSLYEKISTAEHETGLPNLTVGANYQIQSWISGGKPVTGLDKYIHDPEWGFSPHELADFNEIFLQQDVIGDTRFGMPAVRTAQMMYYNTAWAQELGFSSPPQTAEDFKEQVCAAAQDVKANADNQDTGGGGWLINTTPSSILSWLYAFDSSVLLPNESGYQFNSPESANAMLFLKELFDEGCAYELLESPAEADFANRRALMITSSLSDIDYQNSEFERLENSDSWTVTGFPSPGGEPAFSVYGPSYVMFAGTPEENLAAWLVIKWLLSPEQAAKLIQARGTFPIRTSTMDFLEDYESEHPRWAAAQELLVHAQAEPGLESWGAVRWILGDVGTQIFRYYFTAERIPATLELMDETAEELHSLSE